MSTTEKGRGCSVLIDAVQKFDVLKFHYSIQIGSFILMGERPSQSKLRTVSRREETDSMKDSDKEEAKAENGLLQSIFGAFLAFPNYVAVGLEGLLNGVVGKLLGNGLKIKTSDSEDFR